MGKEFLIEKTDGYTIMSNYHLRDKKISLKAKGLLSHMLSLPDDWDYSIRGLSAIEKDGIDSIRSAILELEKAGYIRRTKERGKDGRIVKQVYEVFMKPHIDSKKMTKEDNVKTDESIQKSSLQPQSDFPQMDVDGIESNVSKELYPDTKSSLQPQSDFPQMENPLLENPLLENPLLENPTEINTNQINTNQINKLNNKYPNQSNLKEGRKKGNGLKDIKDNSQQDVKSKYIEYFRQEFFMNNIDGHMSERELSCAENIIDILVDVMSSDRPTIKIGGENLPSNVVKGRLMKLKSYHFFNVLNSIMDRTNKINNIKAYVITALYNEPATYDLATNNANKSYMAKECNYNSSHQNCDFEENNYDFDELEKDLLVN